MCIIAGKGPRLEREGNWNEHDYTYYATFDRDSPQSSEDVRRQSAQRTCSIYQNGDVVSG